ncbi:MAG: FmdB family zinc ribbon protein [Desulfobacteraceae bacterium]
MLPAEAHRLDEEQCLMSELTMEGLTMPTYEFICQKCEKPFSLVMSISEYEKKNFRCPECKSKRVKQQISHFQTQTSKKS